MKTSETQTTQMPLSPNNDIKAQLESYVSANVLCNYMRNPELLKLALRDLCLRPRYFEEDLRYLEIEGLPSLTFPMLCFCDIPFGKVAHHMGKYGHYGIVLKKQFRTGGTEMTKPDVIKELTGGDYFSFIYYQKAHCTLMGAEFELYEVVLLTHLMIDRIVVDPDQNGSEIFMSNIANDLCRLVRKYVVKEEDVA